MPNLRKKELGRGAPGEKGICVHFDQKNADAKFEKK